MGHVHHPGIKERGIAPLQLPSYQRPGGLDPSSLAATPFRGNGSQRPLEPGFKGSSQRFLHLRVARYEFLHNHGPWGVMRPINVGAATPSSRPALVMSTASNNPNVSAKRWRLHPL